MVLHQRARIHGAMIEAVAQHGYESTSVKQVIGLAGVSRRSFYEQFANKEECFLATFDLVVRREIKLFRKLYLATDGPLERRVRVVFKRFAKSIEEDRNAAVLVVLAAPSAGPGGVVRLRRATSAVRAAARARIRRIARLQAAAGAHRPRYRRRPAWARRPRSCATASAPRSSTSLRRCSTGRCCSRPPPRHA